MPKRTYIKKILIIGSGPIIIGQGCEFDYSGTQACKALREEGYEVVLINSNPATIMTDPGVADRTYIEPITLEILEQILEREHPDLHAIVKREIDAQLGNFGSDGNDADPFAEGPAVEQRGDGFADDEQAAA